MLTAPFKPSDGLELSARQAFRCHTERCPRAGRAAAPRKERQHMGTASAKSAGARPSPASVPAAEAPQRQGGIAAKGGGGEGKVIL